jgi:hypothetical protein
MDEVLRNSREIREIKERIEGLEIKRVEIGQELEGLRGRREWLEREERREEARILGEVWKEYWERYWYVERCGYLSGEEKSRMGMEEASELNRERKRVASKRRYRATPGARLSRGYRHRASKVLGANPERYQCGSLGRLIGCTVAGWREHLERQFEKGMSWENYGVKWDVDHVMPISSFDLTKEEGIKGAFNWLNTRPMWKWANNRKGAKITEPQLQLVLEVREGV